MTFLKCDVVGAFVVDSFIQSRHAWPALRRTWHQRRGAVCIVALMMIPLLCS